MTVEPATASPALDTARRRRQGLRQAMVALEKALAGPAADRTSAWLTEVFGALVGLREALAEHVEGTEGQGGLFSEVERLQPRLQHQIERLTHEHRELHATVDDALSQVHELTSAGPRAEEVRERLLQLILGLARHRQAGADLVWEAYAVDIGGGD